MSSQEIFSSWKEIATYLNKGVRTVQRWEAELKLPVVRPKGAGYKRILAYRSDLDVWMKSEWARRPEKRIEISSHTSDLILTAHSTRTELTRTASNFLLVELDLCRTFLAGARSPAYKPEQRMRCRQHAARALESITGLLERIDFEHEFRARTNEKLKEIAAELKDTDAELKLAA